MGLVIVFIHVNIREDLRIFVIVMKVMESFIVFLIINFGKLTCLHFNNAIRR